MSNSALLGLTSDPDPRIVLVLIGSHDALSIFKNPKWPNKLEETPSPPEGSLRGLYSWNKIEVAPWRFYLLWLDLTLFTYLTRNFILMILLLAEWNCIGIHNVWVSISLIQYRSITYMKSTSEIKSHVKSFKGHFKLFNCCNVLLINYFFFKGERRWPQVADIIWR